MKDHLKGKLNPNWNNLPEDVHVARENYGACYDKKFAKCKKYNLPDDECGAFAW